MLFLGVLCQVFGIAKQSTLNNKYLPNVSSHSFLCTSAVSGGIASRAETTSAATGLTKLQAQELVLRLTIEERVMLVNALNEYESKLIKDGYEGNIFYSYDHTGFV